MRGRCRVCGCTDEDPCIGTNEFGDDATCGWADAEHTLCTACADVQADDDQLVQVYSDAEASAFLRGAAR